MRTLQDSSVGRCNTQSDDGAYTQSCRGRMLRLLGAGIAPSQTRKLKTVVAVAELSAATTAS